MTRPRRRTAVLVGAAAAAVAVAVAAVVLAMRAGDGGGNGGKNGAASTAASGSGAAGAAQPASGARPALTVAVVQPQRASLALTVAANGSVAAWQEAIVGAESNGWRVTEVHVNVGDVVRRGQLLATFSNDIARADIAQTKAALDEADANAAEAAANAQRARELQQSGALSAQQINQYLTAERTAQARLEAQRAAARTQALRFAQAQVLAPDDGVISARTATVGAVAAAGQELFRLIRGGRLEWRAEVAAADLGLLKPGQPVRVTPAGGNAVDGKVRIVAPTVDAATRNGTVYVDLKPSPAVKAGMFARGEFDLGASSALTLPQGAVLLRDGYAYIFEVGADSRVRQRKVALGRRVGDRVEVTGPLDPAVRAVASGGAFLADGDVVRVVAANAPPAASAGRPAVKP